MLECLCLLDTIIKTFACILQLKQRWGTYLPFLARPCEKYTGRYITEMCNALSHQAYGYLPSCRQSLTTHWPVSNQTLLGDRGAWLLTTCPCGHAATLQPRIKHAISDCKCVLMLQWHTVMIFMQLNHNNASVLWHCWMADRTSLRLVKNWLMWCWYDYLSGAKCKWFAYGPADAAGTPIISCFIKVRGKGAIRRV